MPKKVRKSALKMALSSKYQNNDLIVMDSFVLEEIKTKKFFVITEKLNVKKALVVVDEKDENLELSSRNLQGFKVIHINGLNVYDILRYNSLILLEASLKGIEGRLS